MADNVRRLKDLLYRIGLIKDYVVETGTDNGWKYRKYANGYFSATWEGPIAVGAGTAWCGQYYHWQSSALSVPSFATSYELISATKQDAKLAWYVGFAKTATTLQTVWLNGASGSMSAANFGYVLFEISGSWS